MNVVDRYNNKAGYKLKVFTSEDVPLNPVQGNMYYDDVTGEFYAFNGIQWIKINPYLAEVHEEFKPNSTVYELRY